MVLLLIQIAALAAVILYFGSWLRRNRRRNAASWDSLLARLRPDWSAREVSNHFLWRDEINATPNDAWQRMEGPKGLWVMHQNACVMLEMADYAAKHSPGVDLEMLATLRSDAMHIRLCVLMALGQYAFSQAGEGVRVNAFRAAQMYTAMAARMTRFLQEYAAGVVPDFVAAM